MPGENTLAVSFTREERIVMRDILQNCIRMGVRQLPLESTLIPEALLHCASAARKLSRTLDKGEVTVQRKPPIQTQGNSVVGKHHAR